MPNRYAKIKKIIIVTSTLHPLNVEFPSLCFFLINKKTRHRSALFVVVPQEITNNMQN